MKTDNRVGFRWEEDSGCSRDPVSAQEGEAGTARPREDNSALLLALRMEGGAMSQGMQRML